MLYGMVKATGKANAKRLKMIARGEIDVIQGLEASIVDDDGAGDVL